MMFVIRQNYFKWTEVWQVNHWFFFVFLKWDLLSRAGGVVPSGVVGVVGVGVGGVVAMSISGWLCGDSRNMKKKKCSKL